MTAVENMTFWNRYMQNRSEHPSMFYGSIMAIVGFVFGLILYALSFLPDSTRLGGTGLFLNIGLLGFVMVVGSFLQTERMISVYSTIFGPLIKSYQDRKYKIFALYALAIFLVIFVILFMLTLRTDINFLQQTTIAIIVAANLIMVSVGLTLTTRVRKFSNFAQSEFVIVGIYVSIALSQIVPKTAVGLFLNKASQWFFFELILAFIVTGLVGILAEVAIFGPLTRRNATPLSLMVASIGLGLVIRQVIQEMFGSIPRTSPPNYPDIFGRVGENIQTLGSIPVIGWFFTLLSTPFAENSIFTYQGYPMVRISRDETWSIVICIITLVILQYLFTKTTLGISMRATADDAELAQITGINTNRVIFWTWFIAAGVTGAGAIFFFESAQIQPGSGFAQLLLIFAVVILGGFDSFEGTVISGFIISFSMSTAVIVNGKLAKQQQTNELLDHMVFWSTSGDWKLAIAFAIIIVVLIFRPRGIFGLIDPKSKL